MECSRCDAEFFDDLEYGFPLVLCPRCAEQNEQSIAALEAELAAVEADKVQPGSYKQARGAIPWHEGDEPAEVIIRRIRGAEVSDYQKDLGELATCPNCGGDGSIPHQDRNGDLEREPCQLCDTVGSVSAAWMWRDILRLSAELAESKAGTVHALAGMDVLEKQLNAESDVQAALRDELAEVKAERDNWHRRAAWYESGDAARDAARYELSNEQLTQE